MKPVPGIDLDHQPDKVAFTCTLVAEAANDGGPGMSAVAQVIMNRTQHAGHWPSTPGAVCKQPWQFSSWNQNDPNRAKMLDFWKNDPTSYALAEQIVEQALAGSLPDTVGPSTHYCTNGLHGTLPLWGFDDSAHIAAGHHPRWYSRQAIESGETRLCAVVGRQTFGTAA